MNLLVRVILVMLMMLQPLLLQVGATAACEVRPAAVSAAVEVMPGCGMPVDQCCCKQEKIAGCDCSVRPADVPVVPERPWNPAFETTVLILVAIVVWSNTCSFEDVCQPAFVFSGTLPRISVDSIQSLLCVWRT